MTISHLRDLIPKAANKLKLHGEMKAAFVIKRATTALKEIFSEQLFHQIRIKKFKDGVLWVGVTHSIVAQEIQMKSSTIMEKVNESIGHEAVKQVRSYQESPDPEEEH
jgi:hypothetical protein